MSAPIPNLMTVEQLAEHYGKAKKTIQNKLTRGWGPTPVTDPDTMQVLGFEVEEVAKRSPSYGKAVSPWKSDYEAMAKKTVIRRAFPYLPVSVEARDAAASDDQTPDYSDVFRPLPTVTADDSPVDASVDEPEEPEQSQPEAQPEVSPVEAKRAEAIARFQRLGVTDEQEALQTVAKITGMASESFADLSEAELDKVLGELKASVKEGK